MPKKILAALLTFAVILVSVPLQAQEFVLTPEDEQFLDLVQKKAFDFFVEESHPRSGLVKDKASNVHKDTSTIASIASTGFALSAMCVGAERGWITKAKAEKYCKKTLRFFLNSMEHNHGWYYHFVHWETGKKTNQTELSSIDTALLIAGALTAASYFKGTEVEELAMKLYERIDFPWMTNGGKTLTMGWDRRDGFLKPRWDSYNEGFILYLLAVSSPTHPIPADSWKHVKKRIGIYADNVLIYCPPLFTHQYSQIWADLRGKNDGVADYFENSRVATIVNRQFCLDNRDKYKSYSRNSWGLTASLGPNGYKAYGSQPGGAVHDGTIAPTAAAGSIVFTPELSIEALKHMYTTLQDKIWGKYGFSDAYNIDREWYSDEVIGIDQGPIVLMIENLRTGKLWQWFNEWEFIQKGMDALGFVSGTKKLTVPERPRYEIPRLRTKIRMDGKIKTKEWGEYPVIRLTPSDHAELGEISDPEDSSGELQLAWTPGYLYVAAKIKDQSLVMNKSGDKIWKDDCLELFFDPQENELKWASRDDFQIGLAPAEEHNMGKSWSWFQGYDPVERKLVKLRVRRELGGYSIEAKISWKFLGFKPEAGAAFGFTPALHDSDLDGTESKLNWFYMPDGKTGSSILGRAVIAAGEAPPPTSTS